MGWNVTSQTAPFLEYAFYTVVEGADTKAISMRKFIFCCCSVGLKVNGGRTGTSPGSCQEKEPCKVWNQQTRELISARKRNTNTTTETRVTYGNSYLAYKLARFGLATRRYYSLSKPLLQDTPESERATPQSTEEMTDGQRHTMDVPAHAGSGNGGFPQNRTEQGLCWSVPRAPPTPTTTRSVEGLSKWAKRTASADTRAVRPYGWGPFQPHAK